MIEGLVISEDKALFEEFNINLSSERHIFEYADSVESAAAIIELELPDYLIIFEKSVDDAFNIINSLFQKNEINKIPVLCFLSAAQWSQREKLWKAGVKDIIQLPIAKDELQLLLQQFIINMSDVSFDQEEAGMYGKLEDYNLLDLIQTLESSKKTGVLVLYRSREEGKIWFNQGQIHDAKYRSLKPLPAILKLITWLDGDFSISFVDENYEKLIEENNQKILLDAIQYIDQRNKILDILPDLNEILLISPEADMDQMNEEEVTYLRFFHGGQTISAYLDLFDEDDRTLLEYIQGFIEKKLLLTKEEFELLTSEQDREAENVGIKKVFKKFFKRKEDEKTHRNRQRSSFESDNFAEDDLLEHLGKKNDSLFQRSNLDLDRIIKKIDNL